MKWLLWREYRINRWILVTGSALILLSYLTEVIVNDSDSSDLFGAWLLGCISAYLTVALLAGNAIAGERADRSAEFIAYLPLGRLHIVASKLLLFLITFAVIGGVAAWTANQVVMPVGLEHHVDVRGFVIAILIIYGVGWMFSSLLSSPTYATLCAFCSLVLVSAGVMIVANYLGVPVTDMANKEAHEIAIRSTAMTGLPVAAICFSIGTWNFVRRCER